MSFVIKYTWKDCNWQFEMSVACSLNVIITGEEYNNLTTSEIKYRRVCNSPFQLSFKLHSFKRTILVSTNSMVVLFKVSWGREEMVREDPLNMQKTLDTQRIFLNHFLTASWHLKLITNTNLINFTTHQPPLLCLGCVCVLCWRCHVGEKKRFEKNRWAIS